MEFNENPGPSAGTRRRARPDKRPDLSAVCTQQTPVMSCSLYIPTFAPPQSTLMPPFPCLWFLPKHTISFVRSPNAPSPLRSPYPPSLEVISGQPLPRTHSGGCHSRPTGLMSSWDALGDQGRGLCLMGLLGFYCLALCCSASLCLERLEEGKCHSCLQEEQEEKSGKL